MLSGYSPSLTVHCNLERAVSIDGACIVRAVDVQISRAIAHDGHADTAAFRAAT